MVVVCCCEVTRREVGHGVMKGSCSCRSCSSGSLGVMGWFCCV